MDMIRGILHHLIFHCSNPDSKVHGANMGPIWGRQDPGGPHVGPLNFAIWEDTGHSADIKSLDHVTTIFVNILYVPFS